MTILCRAGNDLAKVFYHPSALDGAFGSTIPVQLQFMPHSPEHLEGGSFGEAPLDSGLNLHRASPTISAVKVGFLTFCFVLGLLPVLTACGPSGTGGAGRPASGAGSSSTTNAIGQAVPTSAQPKLKTIKLWLGSRELDAEVAMTPEQITAGMMHRTNMLENEAMLFVFSQKLRPAFWMKNTLVPLSLAYIDPSGSILEIHDLKPLDETPVQASSDQIQFVLETTRGWFQRNGVSTNMMVRTERGSLLETFLGRQ